MSVEGTVQRATGANIASVIAQTLAKDQYTAIVEFASNSYDADAENFGLTVDFKGNRAVFEDDGTGMDEEGIDSFFRSGDSDKIANPVTAKGRRKIGKKGVATALLEYLADEYVLDTWQNGRRIIVREKFSDSLGASVPQGEIHETDDKGSGTKITLLGLRFSPSILKLKKLQNVLEWEVPSLPDFNVSLNGVLIPKRSVVTWCTEYSVDAEVEGVGKVQGSIFYKDKGSLPAPGIFIYVNGRAVGDPASFGLERYWGVMKGRVVGMIHADGLESKIGFDRSRFEEDATEYQAVRTAIEEVLRGITPDIRSFVSPRRYYGERRRIPKIEQLVQKVEARLNKALVVDKTSRSYKLELVLDDNNSWLSRYDKDTGVISFNVTNPQIAVATGIGRGTSSLENVFTMLSLSAIAEASLDDKKNSSLVFDLLADNIRIVSRQLYNGMNPIADTFRVALSNQSKAFPLSEVSINQYRLYSFEELCYLTGRTIPTIRRLYRCGALESFKSVGTYHKFRADSILPCLERIEGYVSAGEVLVPEHYFDNDNADLRKRDEDAFLPLEQELAQKEDLPSYVFNIGTRDRPFMWVQEGKISEFKRYYGGST